MSATICLFGVKSFLKWFYKCATSCFYPRKQDINNNKALQKVFLNDKLFCIFWKYLLLKTAHVFLRYKWYTFMKAALNLFVTGKVSSYSNCLSRKFEFKSLCASSLEECQMLGLNEKVAPYRFRCKLVCFEAFLLFFYFNFQLTKVAVCGSNTYIFLVHNNGINRECWVKTHQC